MLRTLLNIGILISLLLPSVQAIEVNINVAAPSGEVIPGAALVLKPKNTDTTPSSEPLAIMDQVDRQFKPRILVVPKGTPVSFPNSDSIQHHVYSFSPAKVFEIQLYKGSKNEPVVFNKAGVVELGCNVHDWMLGYIYVADSSYYTQLDPENNAKLNVPAGEYEVSLWHPRLSQQDMNKSVTLKITEDMQTKLTLEQSLLPDPFAEEEESFDEFDIYE